MTKSAVFQSFWWF